MRKILQKEKQVHFRIAEVFEIHSNEKEISTSIGFLKYDFLVLAMGANTNFFGQQNIEQHALSMKTASDAILIRNTILENFEMALLETDRQKIGEYLNIILVGGGPTGVELAGALAEMKKYIFPKDYPELDLSKMRIVIYEASPKLLAAIQQAKFLGDNLIKMNSGAAPKYFEYTDKGSMATIGRNLAVADLPFGRLKGFIAWALWSFVHLFMIVGVKNRFSIFMNWSWNYFTYDQSLRLLIKPKSRVVDKDIVGCVTNKNETEINDPVLQKEHKQTA